MAMIGIGFFYVLQTSRQTRQAVGIAMTDRANELGQSSNPSKLAILRSLLSDSHTPDAKSYQPALFPTNYFDKHWTFLKNDNFNLNHISWGKENLIKLKAQLEDWMGSDVAALEKMDKLITSLQPMPARLSESKIEIPLP